MPKSQPTNASATASDAEMRRAEIFAQNAQKIAGQCQQIMNVYLESAARDAEDMQVQDSLHVYAAFSKLFETMLTNPARWWEMQMAYWQDYFDLWNKTAQAFSGTGDMQPKISPDPKDRRFKDKAWQESVVFDFLKQSYLLTAEHIQQSVKNAEGLDEPTRKKIEFYTRQFVDAMAPSNFLMTNPEVLRATLESGGENLVNGLEHVLEDLKRGKGNLRISTTEQGAFEVGRNLATTPGKVIYQNELMQLIQYEPATEMVHKTPLLIIPAWINKYYIFDLKPENSFVKWAVEQGFTVFIISWVNPDEKMRLKTFEDYLNLGPLAALSAIEQATGEKQVAALGYCLGGTLLATTLAYLHAKGEAERIVSASFLTTMTDFADAGDLSVFIDEAQLQAVENRMAKQGYLEGPEMATTFSMLRANDLIWSFVVNNYLLGKDPFPFDLLYWNSDSTHMPAVMHSYYLRTMYQQNKLVEPGGITLNGTKLDLRSIKTPSYFLSTREDHIAPWKATYAATNLFSGEKRFVLAASGHVAGVINPPAKNKYCFWTTGEKKQYPKTPDAWLQTAKESAGSWWPDWEKWQKARAGGKVPARRIGAGKLKPIEAAPGSYVKVPSE